MNADQTPPRPLAGKRILVPESRELDLFVRLLEAEGAVTARCPLVAIRDLDDPAPVEAWLKRFIAGSDDLILLTGEGLRRLLGVARRAGLDDDFVAALKRVRTVTRGPKPARVLRELGLSPGLAAETPTTAGVIASLQRENLNGHRIGVQLYPGNPNDALLDFLRGAGAITDVVLPYRYASDAETQQVEEAISGLAAGAFDAVAFTSTPQVTRLMSVAKDRGIEAELRRGLADVKIAAVGPVVGAALEGLGLTIAAMPEKSFHMKPLVTALGAALARP